MQPSPRPLYAFSALELSGIPVCLICLFLFFSRFIDIDIDKAMQRVLKRHISTGITVHFSVNFLYISTSSA